MTEFRVAGAELSAKPGRFAFPLVEPRNRQTRTSAYGKGGSS